MSVELETWNLELDENNMKLSDVFLIILFIALIAGMLLTAIFGRGSRHGYGMAPVKIKAIKMVSLQGNSCNNNLTAMV